MIHQPVPTPECVEDDAGMCINPLHHHPENRLRVSWLIESRDPITKKTHDYVEDIDARYPRIVFTKDAGKAARFVSKDDAQSMLDACRTIDPDGVFKVEDHMFDCGIAPESDLPPLKQEALTVPRFLRKNDD